MKKGKPPNAQCAETQAGERHVGAETAPGGARAGLPSHAHRRDLPLEWCGR